jgi:two-component system, LytTR family, response regulator
VTRFTVLVAEDEPRARAMLVSLLKRDAEIETLIDCADADETRAALGRHRVDIAFLDVEMPGATGVEIASGLAARGPTIVFVTAHSRYALPAFDVAAVDYVLKPFSDERLFAALNRAKARVRERRLGELASEIASVPSELKVTEPAPAGYLTRLPYRDGHRSLFINANDIVMIEAEDYYVRVHSKSGRHLLRTTLTHLEERLDPKIFLRVHRTAIVNIGEVVEIREEERMVLVLSSGVRVPVSRSRRRDVEPVLRPRLRTSPRGESAAMSGSDAARVRKS